MVYTGIVQTVGTARFDPQSWTLCIRGPPNFWDKSQVGDSIAVNGVCFTLLKLPEDGEAEFFVMEETRNKTTFDKMMPPVALKGTPEASSIGSKKFDVNIEHSLRMGDSIGGHKVMGHVDGVGTITKISLREDGSKDLWVEYKHCISAFGNNVPIVHKGSICLDGVSLTVAELKDTQLRVALIPHTQTHTTLGKKKEGDKVNIEFDHDLVARDSGNSSSAVFSTDNDLIAHGGSGGSSSSSSSVGSGSGFGNNTKWNPISDEEFMLRAIQLGENGKITAPPNPWVACVIVASDGATILGEGYHHKAGEPHAEIMALRDAKERGNEERVKGSTAYVTLEPCHHFGRTPPCDAELIKQGVARVVIALLDPDKRVSGMGAQKLRDNGVHVVVGIAAAQAHKSLEAYLHQRTTGLPYCVLKVALSLDGKIACADCTSQWITGQAAREHAHKIRSVSQALIVGSRTAGIDRPQLTVRLPGLTDCKPLRVVLDTRGVINTGPLMDTSLAPTLMFHGPQVPKTQIERWARKGVEAVCLPTTPLPDARIDLHAVMADLGARGFLRVMVEGGAEVHSEFIKCKLVDELVIYYGACILGSTAQPWARSEIYKTISDVEFMKLEDVQKLGNDVVMTYKRATPSITVTKQ